MQPRRPPRCIACRLIGDKRCWGDNCFWAPYFPLGQIEKEDDFSVMHLLFDGSKVRDVLDTIPDDTPEGKDLRQRALDSFVWEAKLWRDSPENPARQRILSCEQRISILLRKIHELRNPGAPWSLDQSAGTSPSEQGAGPQRGQSDERDNPRHDGWMTT